MTNEKKFGMGQLPKELNAKFDAMATDHAKFLAECVFIPAYTAAFTHGAKHMYEHLALSQTVESKCETINIFGHKVPIVGEVGAKGKINFFPGGKEIFDKKSTKEDPNVT